MADTNPQDPQHKPEYTPAPQTPEQNPANVPLEEPTYNPHEIEPNPGGPEIPPPSTQSNDPFPPEV